MGLTWKTQWVAGLASLALAGVTLTPVQAGSRWPQFRGPHGSGVAAEDRFPLVFGAETNCLWRTEIPPGHSSPIVWDDRIFLTGFSDPSLETLCLDRQSGTVLWRMGVPAGGVERGSGLGSPAAPTPVTDGTNVWSYFGPFGLVAYDFSGKEVWRRPLPPPLTQHGVGTSPILCDHALLLLCDQDRDSYLLAVDKQTGKDLWRRERPGFRRGFSTPLALEVSRRKLIIVPGTLRAVAYDAADGGEVWQVGGLPNEICPTPVGTPEMVYLAGWTPASTSRQFPAFETLLQQADADKDGRLSPSEVPPGPAQQHFKYIDANRDDRLAREEYEAMAAIFARSENALLAVRPDGRGDLSTNVVWKHTRGLPYVPSPLLYQGRLYLVKNGGLASCFRAADGEVLYQEERLGTMGDYYASPVAAGGYVCCAAQPGTLAVLRDGATLEVVARNSLGEEVLATPAIADGRLYVRGRQRLFAFGEGAAVSSGGR